MLGIWFTLQLWVRLRERGGGVAYFAHIGGFAFGLLRDQAVAHDENGDGRRAPPRASRKDAPPSSARW